MEEAPTTPIPAPPVLHTPPPPPPPSPPTVPAAPSLLPPPTPPSPAVTTERDGGRRGGGAGGSGGGRLGLTKEVLSAHTQQEEQNFMCRFRDLSQLKVFDPASVLRRNTTTPITRGMDIIVHIHLCIHKQKHTLWIYTHISLLGAQNGCFLVYLLTYSDRCNQRNTISNTIHRPTE